MKMNETEKFQSEMNEFGGRGIEILQFRVCFDVSLVLKSTWTEACGIIMIIMENKRVGAFVLEENWEKVPNDTQKWGQY